MLKIEQIDTPPHWSLTGMLLLSASPDCGALLTIFDELANL
jgi:hypothetical protein